MINKEPVISIQNINHYYGRGSLRRQILFDINLAVYPGEIVIMTGPSGSGKTTLLSLIGGLRSVQEGSLKFLGEELYGASQSKLVQMRRNIGYIFQAHNLLGFLTARQNVQMAVELNHSISQSAAISQSEAMLTAVGLQERINYYPDNLSGGQKQRIAIARALLKNPEILILDEATSALDSLSERLIQESLEKLSVGRTVIAIAHRLSTIAKADKVVVLEQGKIVEQGAYQDLLQQRGKFWQYYQIQNEVR